jgi:hypothetical protein
MAVHIAGFKHFLIIFAVLAAADGLVQLIMNGERGL